MEIYLFLLILDGFARLFQHFAAFFSFSECVAVAGTKGGIEIR